MISPESGKFWFTLAIGITLMSLVLLTFLHPGTAAYYIDLFSLIVGVVMLVVIIILVRKANK